MKFGSSIRTQLDILEARISELTAMVEGGKLPPDVVVWELRQLGFAVRTIHADFVEEGK